MSQRTRIFEVTPVPGRNRRLLIGTVLLAALGLMGCSAARVPELFRLNKERQEEGYYMGEFEFKMLGLTYLLDKGEYSNALGKLEDLREQLKTRKGLIKVPAFETKQQELEFFLGLQDPNTGAFMDASFPYCVYEGPTGNVLEHLEALARETGQPLRLRYPLRFFDAINTPEKLKAFLDDIAYPGWLARQFPQTSFHIARNHLAYAEENNVLERNHLYAFSPEWKRALLEWFHDNQDPETGFWGPRSSRGGKLAKLDLNNTSSIMTAFVDAEGRDRSPEFPLRYRERIFGTALEVLAAPMPDRERLDELHEWALVEGKGLRTLLVYLWRDGSAHQRAKALTLLEAHVRVLFERYYLPHEGAFSYYPDAEHATLDGTGSAVARLRMLGAFSRARQERLWPAADSGMVRSELAVARIGEQQAAALLSCEGANSVRLYASAPSADSYAANVAWVVYPGKTPFADAADLLPRLRNWLESTSQSMGNWVSREAVLRAEELAGVRDAKVITHNFPLAAANALLREHGKVTVIAFDLLQRPRCETVFRLEREEVAPLPVKSVQP